MKHILHIISSIQPKESYSIQLGNAIIEKIQEKYPNSTVEESNLVGLEIPHLNPESLRKLFTPKEYLNEEEKESIKFSDNLLQQLQMADIIVIGAPLYNFTIHSALKAWIDQIVRPGIAFTYSEEGIVGLIKNKKAYLALSSGGVYSDGLSHFSEYALNHLKTVLEFIGITDVSTYRAEGLAYPSLMDTALTKAISSIEI